ncbi:MAG: DUF559 domain-containing protein [Solirubrobacterales bacterium]
MKWKASARTDRANAFHLPPNALVTKLSISGFIPQTILKPLMASLSYMRQAIPPPGYSSDIERVALCIGQRQHGVVSRRQLLAAGVPRSTIDFRIQSLLFPLFRSVFAVGRPQIGQHGLWMAGVLAAGDRSALGGRSAAAAWDFLPVRPGVDVVRVGNRRAERPRIVFDGRYVSVPLIVRRTRSLPEQDIRQIGPIPVLSPARVLLDLAPNMSSAGFKRAFIEADRLGLLEDDDLFVHLNCGRGRPGAAAFRSLVLDRIPDLKKARSLLEGLMLEACRAEGIEAPEINVVIDGHEVDCVWRDRRLAVELDSYGFHRGQEMFEIDLSRNNRMWSMGWVLLRYTWRKVTREPALVVSEVRAALTNPANLSEVESIRTD